MGLTYKNPFSQNIKLKYLIKSHRPLKIIISATKFSFSHL